MHQKTPVRTMTQVCLLAKNAETITPNGPCQGGTSAYLDLCKARVMHFAVAGLMFKDRSTARSVAVPTPPPPSPADDPILDRLVGLVVKASASRAEDPGFESRLRRDFSGVESYR